MKDEKVSAGMDGGQQSCGKTYRGAALMVGSGSPMALNHGACSVPRLCTTQGHLKDGCHGQPG